ncbi:MAG: alpha/beta hydrolase [Alphaproteobacteria bacterium]|jgi:pimeloyl-ACP methyl ester carboxylesterase|nr:alpha/beta hydrolase [Alphaproteobacteria bacterium]MDP6564756.1 alpha/beta hydrolase [Alphaproteobacteria bacterium]MDP6813299.1 alpha/beta hydrolase [Alphaproteobacteria bacterium]
MTTFVLLHGSYQGGWIWQPVATLLRAQGHRVYAPTLDGCGERAGQLRPGITVESQAAEIARLLFYEDLDEVVLVGTSSGGMVLAKAAEIARERIGRLVFADALALRHGEAITDIVSRPAAVQTELALGPSREDAENRLFADLEPELRAWAAERCTLHPIAVHTQPMQLETFWSQSWDASVIYCRRAPNPGEAHQRRCAEALGASWHELDTGHYPMLSATAELTELIGELRHGTASFR